MDNEEFSDALIAAEADLRRIRNYLAEGEVERHAGERAVVSLDEHWAQHKEMYKAAGNMVWEQVRLGLLEQLYGWRRQLSQQLQTKARGADTAESMSPPDGTPNP